MEQRKQRKEKKEHKSEKRKEHKTSDKEQEIENIEKDSENKDESEEFGFAKKPDCSKCGKNKHIFKSIIISDNKPKSLGFCSTKCMEDFDFPEKYKKTLKKCKKSKK